MGNVTECKVAELRSKGVEHVTPEMARLCITNGELDRFVRKWMRSKEEIDAELDSIALDFADKTDERGHALFNPEFPKILKNVKAHTGCVQEPLDENGIYI
jgi:hypothetical protein